MNVVTPAYVAIVALPWASPSPRRSSQNAGSTAGAGFVISARSAARASDRRPHRRLHRRGLRWSGPRGYDDLALATFLAGLMRYALGFLRLGTYIKYIPTRLTIGFTAGIGITIFVSPAHDLLGLRRAGCR